MALGVYTSAVKGAKADEYMRVAKAVTYTCWQMYERMPSGALFRDQVSWPFVSESTPEKQVLWRCGVNVMSSAGNLEAVLCCSTAYNCEYCLRFVMLLASLALKVAPFPCPSCSWRTSRSSCRHFRFLLVLLGL